MNREAWHATVSRVSQSWTWLKWLSMHIHTHACTVSGQSQWGERNHMTYWSHWPKSRLQNEMLVAQSCLTLYDPMDCSPPGSSVHGISQARVLEWAAFAFSTMIYEILVILDSRSTMIDPKEPLNSESPFLCFKQRKIMLYTQKAHGSGPTHPKACSVF